MVEATIPLLKRGSLPQLVRHQSKELKAEETSKEMKDDYNKKIIKKISI